MQEEMSACGPAVTVTTNQFFNETALEDTPVLLHTAATMQEIYQL